MKRDAYIWFVLLLCYGCKKPYAPPVIATDNNYLVVEGLVNSGPDSTYIKLSRTTKISSANTVKPELNATVTVEGDNNTVYPLQPAGNGMYVAAALGLSTLAKYRMRIQTTDNVQYLSDFVEAKETPDIDSISYSIQNGGVQFYANTHDPANNTRYYRWDFDETYGYLSLYRSYFKIGADGYPQYRIDQNDKIYECFKTLYSNQVLLGSSAKLGQDVISKQPLDFITQESGKISHGYSLLVRQYALTADGFSYWQNLKKNTEQLGSIFDVLPSEIKGNIHCTTNPAQPVIGFISVSSVKAKRIFLDANATGLFVAFYIPPPTVYDCPQNAISIYPEDSFLSRLNRLTASGDTVLISSITDRITLRIIAYTYAPKECVDCRFKAPKGTNALPVFWPPTEHY